MLIKTWRVVRRILPTPLFCLALALAMPPNSHATAPDVADRSAWVPDDDVQAVVHAGSHTIVGGYFSWWGPYTGAAARFSPDAATSGPPSGQLVVAGGGVLASVSDGNGGAYIGGDFDRVNGAARDGLAHITASGALDPTFAADASNRGVTVSALALAGGNVYVGGEFTEFLGAKRWNLGAVNTSTGALTSWAPCADDGGTNEMPVTGLAVIGSTVFVGGNFTSLGLMGDEGCDANLPKGMLGSVSASTGARTTWLPKPDGPVRALVASGTTLYVGGEFAHVTSGSTVVARKYGAAFNAAPATPTLTTWDPHPNNYVFAMATGAGGKVVIGGKFTQLNVGVPRGPVAVVDGVTGADTPFKTNIQGEVRSLAVSGSHVIAGGEFDSGEHTNLAMAAFATGAAEPIAVQPAGTVESIATLAGSQVIAGGYVTSWQASRRDGLAILDDAGVPTATLALPRGSNVHRLAVSPDGQTVYLFGDDGNGTRWLKKFDINAGEVTSWQPVLPANFGEDIQAMELSPDGQTLYVGGSFTSIGAAQRKNLAAFSTATGAVTPWQPNADGTVRSILADGNRLYVGGDFQHVGTGAEAHAGVARLSASTAAAEAWAPTVDGIVTAMALSKDGTRLYITGAFQHVGVPAQPRGMGAAFSTVTGEPTAFDAGRVGIGGTDIALGGDGADVYVTGDFDNDELSSAAVAFRESDGVKEAWAPMSDKYGGAVYVDAAGGSAWLGSDGITFGSDARPYYAQFTPQAPAPPPNGGIDATNPQVARPTPTPTPTPAPRLVATSSVKKARFSRAKGTSLTVTLSAPAAVTVTVSRCPAHGACKKPRRVRVVNKTLPKGRSTVAIGEKKHRLATGRYVIALSARGNDRLVATAKPLTVTVTH